MQIGALGDIHGAFETVQLIMKRHEDVPLWVCVGDVASNDGDYFTPVAPLYFIKGNNEDFDVLAAARAGHPAAPTLHYLPNGGPYGVRRMQDFFVRHLHGVEPPDHNAARQRVGAE